jgi:hypothetical protein
MNMDSPLIDRRRGQKSPSFVFHFDRSAGPTTLLFRMHFRQPASQLALTAFLRSTYNRSHLPSSALGEAGPAEPAESKKPSFP